MQAAPRHDASSAPVHRSGSETATPNRASGPARPDGSPPERSSPPARSRQAIRPPRRHRSPAAPPSAPGRAARRQGRGWSAPFEIVHQQPSMRQRPVQAERIRRIAHVDDRHVVTGGPACQPFHEVADLASEHTQIGRHTDQGASLKVSQEPVAVVVPGDHTATLARPQSRSRRCGRRYASSPARCPPPRWQPVARSSQVSSPRSSATGSRSPRRPGGFEGSSQHGG
jgi:hypothetical protein